MSMKLNVVLSRKMGLPKYGSLGATVGIELEVEAELANQPIQLQDRVAHLFRLAEEAVNHQLLDRSGQNGSRAILVGASPRRETIIRSVTPGQLRSIRALVDRLALDLSSELRERFGYERPDELTLAEASLLIDTLKSCVYRRD